MKTSFLSLLLLVLFYNQINAQEAKSVRIMASCFGQINVASNFKNSTFINFGGPGIKLNAKKLNLGINMVPSLRYFYDKPRPSITPVLGTSVFAEVGKKKKIVVGCPFYYFASQNKWTINFSLGYVLSKT